MNLNPDHTVFFFFINTILNAEYFLKSTSNSLQQLNWALLMRKLLLSRLNQLSSAGSKMCLRVSVRGLGVISGIFPSFWVAWSVSSHGAAKTFVLFILMCFLLNFGFGLKVSWKSYVPCQALQRTSCSEAVNRQHKKEHSFRETMIKNSQHKYWLNAVGHTKSLHF